MELMTLNLLNDHLSGHLLMDRTEIGVGAGFDKGESKLLYLRLFTR